MLIQNKYDIAPTKTVEEEISLKGSNRKHLFDVTGIPIEVSKKFDKKITTFVDNQFFTKVLEKEFKKTKVSAKHEKITIKLIRKLTGKNPIILHVDDHYLGDYSHVSHFVIVEKSKNNRFLIVDPWYGRKKWINQQTIENAIQSLKKHIKMCPLIYTLA